MPAGILEVIVENKKPAAEFTVAAGFGNRLRFF
jgi:hypothetical protein